MNDKTCTSINKLVLSNTILQGNHGFKVFTEEKVLTNVLKYKGSLLLTSTDRLWFYLTEVYICKGDPIYLATSYQQTSFICLTSTT